MPAAVAQARGPDWLGLQVTAPYKRLVAGLCDHVEADAAAIGAVNSVARTAAGELVGFNTDAPGFRAGVELAMGRALGGRRVVVAGAGGAAHAVVFTCLSAGAEWVTIGNRTVATAAALAERFGGTGTRSWPRWPWTIRPSPTRCDRPTWPSTPRRSGCFKRAPRSTSRRCGQARPSSTWSTCQPETPLLRAARARGLRAANGSEMSIQQAAIAFERWTIQRHGGRDAGGGRAAPRRRRGGGLTRMRFATVIDDGGAIAAVLVDDRRVLPLAGAGPSLDSMRGLAASRRLRRVRDWARQQPPRLYRSLSDDIQIGPAVPDPGAVYAIGLNYAPPDDPAAGPVRPLVYAKLPTSVIGHGAVVSWDRSLTANVDPEVELGVVIGETAAAVPQPEIALQHVFGYTCIDDLVARPMARRRPVAAGQVVRRLLPRGALGRHARRAGGADTSLGCASTTADPGRHHGPHAPLDRRGDRLPQPPHRAAAGGPDRDRHTRQARRAAAAGAPPPARRRGHVPDRGDRGAHDDHRLDRDASRRQGSDEATHRSPRRDDDAGGRGVPGARPDGHRAGRVHRQQPRPAAHRRPRGPGSRPPHRAAGGGPSLRRPSTTAFLVPTSASPASSTSASRPSWRSIEEHPPSLATAGFRRIVFLNGHYDNTYAIAYACANAADRLPKGVRAFPVNYWDGLSGEESSPSSAPRPASTPTRRRRRPSSRSPALRRYGPAPTMRCRRFPPVTNSGAVHTAFFFSSPGSVHRATHSGTWGDARGATAEFGERYLSAVGGGRPSVGLRHRADVRRDARPLTGVGGGPSGLASPRKKVQRP